eukprot:TRINITY_DN2539_c0_g1_i1.p1 TRINITY_DN2539_c0_g1~~TRINITY_DN2539_c0_g1_i1.p1  ORF type:complete len:168 (-),score=26.03 TRINITY_DN2539_c0_g1_i1:413-916(-)
MTKALPEGPVHCASCGKELQSKRHPRMQPRRSKPADFNEKMSDLKRPESEFVCGTCKRRYDRLVNPEANRRKTTTDNIKKEYDLRERKPKQSVDDLEAEDRPARKQKRPRSKRKNTDGSGGNDDHDANGSNSVKSEEPDSDVEQQVSNFLQNLLDTKRMSPKRRKLT